MGEEFFLASPRKCLAVMFDRIECKWQKLTLKRLFVTDLLQYAQRLPGAKRNGTYILLENRYHKNRLHCRWFNQSKSMTLIAPTLWHKSPLWNRTPGINDQWKFGAQKAESNRSDANRLQVWSLHPTPVRVIRAILYWITLLFIFVTIINTSHLWYDNLTQALYFCGDGAVFV